MDNQVWCFTYEVSREEKGKRHAPMNSANANALSVVDLESREHDRRQHASLVRCDDGAQVERRFILHRGLNNESSRGRPLGEAPTMVKLRSHGG